METLAQQKTRELEEALATGHSPALQRFLQTRRRFHRYSLGNRLQITEQFPQATLVAGYFAWKKLGRHVRRGQRGLWIWAPVFSEPRHSANERCTRVLQKYRRVYVFDVSQTAGKPLPELAQVSGDPGEALPRLRELVGSYHLILSYVEYLGGAQGSLIGRNLRILRDLSPARDFMTLAHELAHALLHQGQQQVPHRQRELEAEAVAFVLGAAVGLHQALAQATDYIQLYEGGQVELQQSASRIQWIASILLMDLGLVETTL